MFKIKTELLSEEVRDQLREYVYGEKGTAQYLPNKEGPNILTHTVYQSDLDRGPTKRPDYKTWECHHVISTWDPGGLALFSQTRAWRMNKVTRTAEQHAELDRYLEYFVERSPFAPYILSTASQYKEYGILIDNGIPANLMAILCINSRWIYFPSFVHQWHQLADLLTNEDDAFMASHWLQIAAKSITLSTAPDHGCFRPPYNVSPLALWTWIRQEPCSLTQIYRESVSNSTNYAVYDTFDLLNSRSGTKFENQYSRAYESPLYAALDNFLKLRAKGGKPAALEGLNPFQAAVDWIVEQEKRKRVSSSRGPSFNTPNNPESRESIKEFFRITREAAESYEDYEDFYKWFTETFNVPKVRI